MCLVIISFFTYSSFLTVDGQWNAWTHWSDCQASCGGEVSLTKGASFRTRVCNNPKPQYEGLRCQGNAIELVSCVPGGKCRIVYFVWDLATSLNSLCIKIDRNNICRLLVLTNSLHIMRSLFLSRNITIYNRELSSVYKKNMQSTLFEHAFCWNDQHGFSSYDSISLHRCKVSIATRRHRYHRT